MSNSQEGRLDSDPEKYGVYVDDSVQSEVYESKLNLELIATIFGAIIGLGFSLLPGVAIRADIISVIYTMIGLTAGFAIGWLVINFVYSGLEY